MAENQRQGKFARIPDKIRDLANQRILDGWTGRRICDWLNGLPEVEAELKPLFGESWALEDSNLSRWRKGGYREWLRDRTKVARIQALSEYALTLAEAGGGQIYQGASALLGGQILELLETVEAIDSATGLDDEAATEEGPSRLEALETLSRIVAAQRSGDLAQRKLELDRQKNELGEKQFGILRDKFRRETCELFVKYCENAKAKEIALDGSKDYDTRLAELADVLFGEMPEGIGPGRVA
jgi:hypothetical protein